MGKFTPEEIDILRRALEHLKIEYEAVGDKEDLEDIKIIKSARKKILG